MLKDIYTVNKLHAHVSYVIPQSTEGKVFAIQIVTE